ncbi:MAG TPA: DUF1707 domain-containing protein [Actinomycetota bacterium]|nr:DUF1707 domain-containing protein [Actinomycetota bacterium]
MDRDPGDQRRASLRASNADRERFVEALRQHHTDGRLTTDQLAERAAAEAGMLRSILWYGRYDDDPPRPWDAEPPVGARAYNARVTRRVLPLGQFGALVTRRGEDRRGRPHP